MLDTNGWSSYEKLVMATLERLEAKQDEHTLAISEMKIKAAEERAKTSRDAKWISTIGAIIGTAISAGIHFRFKV